MLKVEEEYILHSAIESYDVLSNIIDGILDSIETHDIVQHILLQLIHDITFQF